MQGKELQQQPGVYPALRLVLFPWQVSNCTTGVCRPWVNPNESFKAQLREFERLGADATRWCAPCRCCHKQKAYFVVPSTTHLALLATPWSRQCSFAVSVHFNVMLTHVFGSTPSGAGVRVSLST